ncbi:hypothetical protein [Dysgonomonas sp.]
MKDTIITARQKKREVITWLVCFLIANLINFYAIVTYEDTSFSELFTSLGYVFVASLAIYFLWTIIRILFYGLKKVLIVKK